MPDTQIAPHDLDAESAILGSMLLSNAAASRAIDLVRPADFYRPAYGHIFAAIESLFRRGSEIDGVTVSDELARFGLSSAIEDDPGIIVRLIAQTPTITAVNHYAEIVVRHSTSRRVAFIARSAQERIAERVDPYELIDTLHSELASIDIPVSLEGQQALTLDEINLDAEEMAPWVIPGIIRQDWRVVLVAGEGSGKSTLLRQIAACAAQGVHPFRLRQDVPAMRVLLVDLENPAAAIAETGRPLVQLLRQRRGTDYDPNNLRIFRRPAGMDPRSRHDRTELEREILLQQPQLVVIGPAYKMIRRRDGESHEEATSPLHQILDELRIRYSFALMIEHHAPQGHGGSRELRPYGSQLWMAWPEMGRTMRQDGDPWNFKLGYFRGDRLRNDWPTELHRSDRLPPPTAAPWPWFGRWSKPAVDHAEQPF